MSSDWIDDPLIDLGCMIFLDKLDAYEDSVIEGTGRANYEDVLRPKIEAITGLEHPDNYQILRYPSGQQMLHDYFESSFEQLLSEEPFENESTDIGFEELFDVLYNFSERIGGLSSEAEEGYNIMYSRNNVWDVARNNGWHFGKLSEAVKAEEGVHTVQRHNFPELFDKKRDLQSQISHPEKKDEFMAIMSSIEGHAQYHVEQIFQGYTNLESPEIEKDLLPEILELEAKSDQYEKGYDFISYIDEKSDLNPEITLEQPPESMEEVENPSLYLERVN